MITIDSNKTNDKFILPLKKLIDKHDSSVTGNENFIAQPVDVYKQTSLILCSSGTTGLPKGVEITHANMMVAFSGVAESRKLIEMVYNQKITAITVAPWFHVLGFVSFRLSEENWTQVFFDFLDGNVHHLLCRICYLHIYGKV